MKYALRSLAKSPGFTLVAVLSLALGIGACTAVFSVANAVLLRALPVPNPHELRVLQWSGTDVRMSSYDGNSLEAGNRIVAADCVHHPLFVALREQATNLADVFGFAPLESTITRLGAEAIAVRGLMVSDNFFSALGVRPLLGRTLAPGHDFVGAGANVVISQALWEKLFARDPGVLGQTVTLSGSSFTIVGVLPRGIDGVRPGQTCDFYVPMATQSPFLYRPPLSSDFHWFVRLMARLNPGATDAQLEAALDVALARSVGDRMKDPRMHAKPGRGGAIFNRDQYRKPLLLMLGAVALVMLVACANLAGLSLARGVARGHELAVRAALGAGRWRLVRQSLAESVVLAGLGGGAGILFAVWGRDGIAQLLVGSADGLRYDLSLDRTVLAFALLAALVTAFLSGLLPAWRAGHTDPLDGLKHHSASAAPRLRIGRLLVAAQIAVSLLLMAGAGLFVRSLVNLARIETGFRVENLLLLQLDIRGSGEANAQPEAYFARVQDALAAVPGAQEAALLDFPLLAGEGSSGAFEAFSGRPAGRSMRTNRLRVGENFFATMGIPVNRGRGFTAADNASAPKVIIVNETFVRRYLPDENPLGLTIKIWDADWEIVGVCADAKYSTLKAAVPPTAYFPFRQMFYSRFRTTHLRAPWFGVRTTLPPQSIVSAARKAVMAIDPGVAIVNITTQRDVHDASIGQERLFASLGSALAGLALLLACIGLYGLMAYNVARRTREIGVRMALGAQPRDVARSILREALVLTALGIGVGLPATFALNQLIKAQLYDVQPNDSLTLVVTIASLLAVALTAAWLPARRATRVDPVTALRAE